MQNLDARTYSLLFDIQRSARYHNHRRAFFELLNRTTSLVAVVGSSSAFALLIADYMWASWVMAGVGLVAAVDVLFGTAKLANEHSALAQQFIALERQFVHSRSLNDDEYNTIVNRRLEIEATEPPIKRLLDFLCDLEVRRAHDNQVQDPKIPWHRRMLAHWVSQIEFVAKTIDDIKRQETQRV